MCCLVAARGFERIRAEIRSAPMETLIRFPYIGPVTVCHLAKNLGFATAKPDRHLVRIARLLGQTSPAELCEKLSRATGDPIQVVDTVLWRYAEQHPGYERQLSELSTVS